MQCFAIKIKKASKECNVHQATLLDTGIPFPLGKHLSLNQQEEGKYYVRPKRPLVCTKSFTLSLS